MVSVAKDDWFEGYFGDSSNGHHLVSLFTEADES